MKKIVALIFSCLLFMCSCSVEPTTYKNKEVININYNNITNYCDFWMTTDSICYLEDSLVQTYFMVDKNSKIKIGTNNGYGFGKIQRYEEKIYMIYESDSIDEYNSKFELKCYDNNAKKSEVICSVKNCDNFLVLDESIYYSEYTWINDFRKLTLKRFSIDSKEYTTIEDNVISFGVIDNCLYYVAEEDNLIMVLKYDIENEESIRCGDFLAEEFDVKTINNMKVSYTQNNIFFSWIDYENETSTILKYSFGQNALNRTKMEGYIDGFVSYKANSYFIISSEKSDNSELYMLNNKTDEITKITEIQGEGSLFVGSDDGVYVLRNKDNNLVFYSNYGNTQVVYKF